LPWCWAKVLVTLKKEQESSSKYRGGFRIGNGRGNHRSACGKNPREKRRKGRRNQQKLGVEKTLRADKGQGTFDGRRQKEKKTWVFKKKKVGGGCGHIFKWGDMKGGKHAFRQVGGGAKKVIKNQKKKKASRDGQNHFTQRSDAGEVPRVLE